MGAGIFDFAGQISFYAAYHDNGINQWIHIFGVPTILWSAFVLMNYFGPICPVEAGGDWKDYCVVTYGFPFYVIYLVYYIILEPFAGLLYAPQLTAMYLCANAFYNHNENALAIALAAHIIAWISQFVGHGVFEGRSPALLDNLVQAFLLAPFFVWMEVLFKLGYRKDLQESLKKHVAMRHAEWAKKKN
mmetsp:Transcript_16636/g.46976  ORF Transcript_16636/g.46976 Transcript_16636/m.46976 type:complete len:189 (+) Transcript_16636:182-748(+)|eukprot:CAMPEP_0119145650 /NCGR_PEP_ID=MMETSP1310-20130426/37824_1 /TAXON_ID=464262 /ORGANISM="Genus nov. species nov., Strain RCC2339" /LENGTH=188 /DNA_ID=CAMNT_0007137481 /DNA_START=138 /DNA_END=707 /DNA_ORIENTATION=-